MLYETLATIGLLIGGLFTLVSAAWVVTFLAGRARRTGGATAQARTSLPPDDSSPTRPGLFDRATRALVPITAFLLMQFGLFLWATAGDVALGKASLGWPTARGVIASSQVETEDRQSGPRYRARIIYGYAIAAHPYSGRQVRFGDIPSDEAQAIVARYPRGKDVTVRYAPEDRHLAVLEPGADPTTRQFMWLCLVVVLVVVVPAFIALGARLAAWRQRRTSGRA